MKFGRVTRELTELICERQVRHGQKTGVFRSIIISGYTWPIFAIFLLRESSLRLDDGSVVFFTTLSREVAMATK